jgi:hypothetical protein
MGSYPFYKFENNASTINKTEEAIKNDYFNTELLLEHNNNVLERLKKTKTSK